MATSFSIKSISVPKDEQGLLSHWLANVLCIDVQAAPALPPFANYLVHTVRLFLELAAIPVFDLPKASSADAGDGTLTLDIEFNDVGLMPQQVYQHAIRMAVHVCTWCARNPVTVENRAALFNDIEQRVVKPIHNTVGGGKSTIPVLRVAHALGIPFMHLGAGAYQLGWGSKARRMDRSASDRDSAIGGRLAQNKISTAALLRLAGLPAPVHMVATNTDEAKVAAAHLGYPLVVKPSDRDRGEGVSVDVVDEATLLLAFGHALEASHNKQVIVERQVAGVCHRLFIAGGKLLYAVKRLPMSIKADGLHSVAELVAAELSRQEQLPPWQRSELSPIDEQALQAMAQDGWDPQSVPAADILVPLRRIESTASGGVDEDASSRIHPENLAIALRAAELFGLDIAGIDIITDDIAQPWLQSGAIINEVNFAPLFGGAEISRSHIPAFFHQFIEGDGKIPVETFTGSEAGKQALARQHNYRQRGLRCFVTSAGQTLDDTGKPLMLSLARLEERARALLCRPDVDALLLVKEQEPVSGPPQEDRP